MWPTNANLLRYTPISFKYFLTLLFPYLVRDHHVCVFRFGQEFSGLATIH